MKRVEIFDGDYSIESVVILLLCSYFRMEKIRIVKVLRINYNSYIFWCWYYISPHPRFVIGQFYIVRNTINWDYKITDFIKWAREAYRNDWFEADGICTLRIGKRDG